MWRFPISAFHSIFINIALVKWVAKVGRNTIRVLTKCSVFCLIMISLIIEAIWIHDTLWYSHQLPVNRFNFKGFCNEKKKFHVEIMTIFASFDNWVMALCTGRNVTVLAFNFFFLISWQCTVVEASCTFWIWASVMTRKVVIVMVTQFPAWEWVYCQQLVDSSTYWESRWNLLLGKAKLELPLTVTDGSSLWEFVTIWYIDAVCRSMNAYG